MNKQKVIIRVDGNPNIGLGHIYRGIALAEMLKEDSSVIFITKPDTVIAPITDVGFKYQYLPEIPFLEEPHWIKQNVDNNAIIICDGYEFKSEYQKKIKQQGFKLVYVDDLVEFHMYADVVINHSPGIKKEDYKAEPYTKFGLGLDYALLRQSFVNYDRSKIKSKIGKNNILVAFGGADPNDFTFNTIAEIVKIKSIKNIIVILGAAYIHSKIFTIKDKRITILRNLTEKEVFKVMTNINVAIVSASTISLELFALGIPMLLGYFVGNQKFIYNGFVKDNLVIPLGNLNYFDFKLLNSFINKIDYINKKVIPLDSKKNIQGLIKNLQLRVRLVNDNDIEFVFQLSNEKLVRINSYTSEIISIEEHTQWFKKQLSINKENFFIACIGNKRIGQVRFVTEDPTFSIIGISISEKFRGKGYAKVALKMAVSKYFKTNSKPVIAYIKKQNIASVKLFKNAGFLFLEEKKIKGIDSFVYIINKK